MFQFKRSFTRQIYDTKVVRAFIFCSQVINAYAELLARESADKRDCAGKAFFVIPIHVAAMIERNVEAYIFKKVTEIFQQLSLGLLHTKFVVCHRWAV